MKGVVLAAPASGSGKTTIAAGLVRALRREGHTVQPYKAGPDYIDTGFLAAAAGRPCRNLDPWAMRPETLAGALDADAELAVVEGVMGLFDGAEGGGGSTADLAALTGWPVVLAVDCAGQGQSVAALLEGFARHRGDIDIAGAILNRVAGDRHEAAQARAAATARRYWRRGNRPGRDPRARPAIHPRAPWPCHAETRSRPGPHPAAARCATTDPYRPAAARGRPLSGRPDPPSSRRKTRPDPRQGRRPGRPQPLQGRPTCARSGDRRWDRDAAPDRRQGR